MELTILLALLLAALISSPIGRGLGEKAATIAATALGTVAAALAWAVFLGTLGEASEPRSVFVMPWIESGTLASEIAFEIDGASSAALAIALSLAAIAQLYGVTLTTPKLLLKVGDSRAMRLASSASLLAGAAFLVILSAGTLLLSAGLIAFALATALALDFNVRSVGAGRAAARGLLVCLIAALLSLLAAAALFAEADAVSFEVLAPLASGLDAAPLTFAFGLAGLALAAALPFPPWALKASEAPGPLAALLSTVAGLMAVTVFLRAEPFLEADPLLLEGLLVATALLAPLAALAQRTARGGLAALASMPVAMAAFAALQGDGMSALILLSGHGLALLLIGVALDHMADHAGEAAVAAQHRGAQITALVAVASAAGLGVPVLLGPVALTLPGYLGQAGALSSAGAFYWPMVVALVLHALALWSLYLGAFHGNAKKKRQESALEREPALSRAMGIVLLALLLAMGVGLGTLLGLKGSGALPAAPLLAGLAGLGLAVLFHVAPVTGAAASLRPVFEGPVFLPEIVRLGLDAPLRTVGRFISDRLDKSLLEAVFAPLSARLLPGLNRRAAQISASRGAPWLLGGVVAAALGVTLVTLAGG